jgi:hypothetical protein
MMIFINFKKNLNNNKKNVFKNILNTFFIMEVAQQQQSQAQQGQQQQIALSKIEIKDENIALNVMVAMLNMAQRRGVFSLEESSKCWECVQKFVRKEGPTTGQGPASAPENITMETVESQSA